MQSARGVGMCVTQFVMHLIALNIFQPKKHIDRFWFLEEVQPNEEQWSKGVGLVDNNKKEIEVSIFNNFKFP